jgi:LysM repeat protein
MKDQGFFSRHPGALILSALLVLAGCASKSPAPAGDRGGQAATAGASVASKDLYTVKRGDTLYSIALDHGLDYRELVAWNNIDNPNRILVGQSLRVRAPGAAAATEAVVVRPINTGTVVEQRSLGSSSPADLLKREPRAGKEPYSEQALARAQAQAVDPVTVTPVVARPEAKAGGQPGSAGRSKVRSQAGKPAGCVGGRCGVGERGGRLDLAGQWQADWHVQRGRQQGHRHQRQGRR